MRGTATVTGRGLHTGAPATVRLAGAAAGTGIVFRRIDLPRCPVVPARVDAVTETTRRTVLEAHGATVQTVEHLLAAVAAWALTDLRIDVDGPEVPIADGSAAAFWTAIAEAEPDAPAPPTHPTPAAPVTVQDGDAVYRWEPGPARMRVTIEWPHPLIGTQTLSFSLTPDYFESELARARTFGFASDIASWQEAGLLRGAEPGCGVLLTEQGLAAGHALRWTDEFVRHKAVDVIGDLALAGLPGTGTVSALRPHHRGNVAFARAMQQFTQV